MNNNCPICGQPTKTLPGTSINAKDGVTVVCPNPACGMADWGHGKTEADAYDIFVQKCGKTGKN